MVLSIIILAVSLSIDALFVGLAYGLEGTRIPITSKLIICLFSCLYAGIAVFVGSGIAQFLPPIIGRLIGAAILMLIGLWMIIKGIVKNAGSSKKQTDNSEGNTIFKVFIKSLGITIQILKNPDAGDIDKSGVIDIRESILLGSALSIDAIGVGIGSALSGVNGWYIPFVIGLFQLLFLSGGLFFGKHFNFIKNLHGRIAAIVPGLFLMALSVLRLL